MDQLQNIPTELWMVIAACVSAGVTLICVKFTNSANESQLVIKLNHERQLFQENLLRDKLEDLYSVGADWVDFLSRHYAFYTDVVGGKLTHNEHVNYEMERSSGKNKEYGRILMLIDMYFPRLKPKYDKFIKMVLLPISDLIHGQKPG